MSDAADLCRIVLTGGPGAGKTSVTRLLAESSVWSRWRDELGGVTAVPEAATQTYAARRTRWDWLDDAGRREVQRAIYHLQVQQEAELAETARRRGDRVLLLDRGTIDGSAYWPDGAEAYWHDLGSSVSVELERYDGVVLLESAATIGIYDGDASNAVRFEDPQAAVESGRALAALWGGHPRQVRVPAREDFEAKVAAAAAAVAAVARGDVE